MLRSDEKLVPKTVPFTRQEGPLHFPGKPYLKCYQVWFSIPDFDAVLTPSEFGVVLPENIARAVEKRQAEFVAGRYCAIQALKKLSIPHYQPEVSDDRSPVWPFGISGSISHTSNKNAESNIAIAVVTRDKEVGIDAEFLIQYEDLQGFTQLILNSDELQCFEKTGFDKRWLFTLIFSVKESFFKAAYPQVKRVFDFDAISIFEIDSEACTVSFRLNYTLSPELQCGRVFHADWYEFFPNALLTLVELTR
ncbi:phosphopantetheinyl transferase component of siderophore synthetase [Oleiphilus messinensis]|uniref:Enterobactin synthase component D n=1 Tax=Oleiphilus messinensis TaxID=141451 RepID=A0A1Y0I972_9GAMM|nr:phosphopantetheinyl transferase component of siderophore synthetase [Oleiphilus messinensis]